MLEAAGIAFIAMSVAVVTFYGLIRLMDYLRWWNEAGLAAFIPMLAVAIPSALVAAAIAVWLIR
jgi:hypothetical protein